MKKTFEIVGVIVLAALSAWFAVWYFGLTRSRIDRDMWDVAINDAGRAACAAASSVGAAARGQAANSMIGQTGNSYSGRYSPAELFKVVDLGDGSFYLSMREGVSQKWDGGNLQLAQFQRRLKQRRIYWEDRYNQKVETCYDFNRRTYEIIFRNEVPHDERLDAKTPLWADA